MAFATKLVKPTRLKKRYKTVVVPDNPATLRNTASAPSRGGSKFGTSSSTRRGASNTQDGDRRQRKCYPASGSGLSYSPPRCFYYTGSN